MSRFLYNASSLGVGGHITRPFDEHVKPHAASVLPVTGGKVSSNLPAYRMVDPTTGALVLAYDSVETSAEGSEDASGNCSTRITARLRGLNVRDRLKADGVFLNLYLFHNKETRRTSYDAEGSRFENLTIDGQPFPVGLKNNRCREAGDYETFKKTCGHPESAGKIVHTLAENSELKDAEDGFGYYYLPDFGRIYFAEWTVTPHSQGLTMLRIELGSPVGGKIVASSGGGNGSFYP